MLRGQLLEVGFLLPPYGIQEPDTGLLGSAARSPTCRYTILTRYTLPFPASFYQKTKSHDLSHFFCFSAKSKQGLHTGALQKRFNKVMNHLHL